MNSQVSVPPVGLIVDSELKRNLSFQQNMRAAAKARSVSDKGYRDDLPGVFFRSRWEANYARYLNCLLAAGKITSWKHEPTTFWFDKIRRGVRSYKPDFYVTEGERGYYVEVKGWMDPKSKTKLKRMRIYHPTVEMILVDQKTYRELERTIGPTIPHWEFPTPRKRAKVDSSKGVAKESSSTADETQPLKRARRPTKSRKSVDSGVA